MRGWYLLKLDQTTFLILAVAGVGAYFLFRPKPAARSAQSERPAGQWGQTYTDSKGRTIVEGVDSRGEAKSFITYNGGSK